MFDFLHPKKFKEELALVFAIESGEVKVMIADFRKNTRPLICWSAVECIDENTDPTRLLPVTLSVIKRACERATAEGFRELREKRVKTRRLLKAYVFLGLPWHVSKNVEVVKKEEKKFFITDEILNEMLARSEVENTSEKFQVIEKAVTALKSNGYVLKNPMGKKVTELEISAFLSQSEEKVVEEIKNVIESNFPASHTVFHTIEAAFFSSLKTIMKAEDMLMVIPEKTLTEIALVRQGRIAATLPLAFGKNMIEKRIASEMEKQDGKSIFQLWIQNKLDAASRAKVEKLSLELKKEWHEALVELLFELTATTLLPNTVAIIGTSLESKIIADWISTEPLSNSSMTSEKFKILLVSCGDFEPFVETPPENPDVVMNALAFFASSI